MAEFKVLHRDELERMGRWQLVRRSLEIDSFGMSLVEIAPGDSIPEHDEVERDQEEVFVVLEGDAVFVIDGVEHPAPAVSLARVDPPLRRTVRNIGRTPVLLLVASAPTTSGFVPSEWN